MVSVGGQAGKNNYGACLRVEFHSPLATGQAHQPDMSSPINLVHHRLIAELEGFSERGDASVVEIGSAAGEGDLAGRRVLSE